MTNKINKKIKLIKKIGLASLLASALLTGCENDNISSPRNNQNENSLLAKSAYNSYNMKYYPNQEWISPVRSEYRSGSMGKFIQNKIKEDQETGSLSLVNSGVPIYKEAYFDINGTGTKDYIFTRDLISESLFRKGYKVFIHNNINGRYQNPWCLFDAEHRPDALILRDVNGDSHKDLIIKTLTDHSNFGNWREFLFTVYTNDGKCNFNMNSRVSVRQFDQTGELRLQE